MHGRHKPDEVCVSVYFSDLETRKRCMNSHLYVVMLEHVLEHES